MASLIKCRKCGGPHVTLKCGKEKQPEIIPEVVEKPKNNYKDYHKDNPREHRKDQYIDKRKIVTVRISNLPDDINVEELNELVSDWGKIGRINISAYESKSAFIDFYYKDEAEYFVKAVDRTPFGNLIIGVEIVQNNY
jgi:RNA recognition motif-containing protein